MTITQQKSIKLTAIDHGIQLEYIIEDSPDSNQFIELSEGDVSLTIPKSILYKLSQALADFE